MQKLILIILFSLPKAQNYIPVVTLSAKANSKLSTLLSKLLERPVYWNEYKRKSENKNATNQYRYFLKENLVEVNRVFAVVYFNRDNDVK